MALDLVEAASTPADGRPARGARRRRMPLAWLGGVPFIGYVAIFLLLPTVIVVFGAFLKGSGGGFTLDNIKSLSQPYVLNGFKNSLLLSAASALFGAVVGAVFSYVIATGRRDSTFRRIVTSACGVLAQFGGVTLAFAFIATLGGAGFLTLLLENHGITVDPLLLYNLNGLVLVYTYFQIPLMVLVFLPAVDGIRPQWREAAESLGGSTWHYWRHVAGPLLFPAFLGSALLLFANAFSAYATAEALISQGGIIIPLQISNTFTSEVVLGQENYGKALALGMVVVVAVVMTLYVVLQRRTTKWLK